MVAWASWPTFPASSLRAPSGSADRAGWPFGGSVRAVAVWSLAVIAVHLRRACDGTILRRQTNNVFRIYIGGVRNNEIKYLIVSRCKEVGVQDRHALSQFVVLDQLVFVHLRELRARSLAETRS